MRSPLASFHGADGAAALSPQALIRTYRDRNCTCTLHHRHSSTRLCVCVCMHACFCVLPRASACSVHADTVDLTSTYAAWAPDAGFRPVDEGDAADPTQARDAHTQSTCARPGRALFVLWGMLETRDAAPTAHFFM
ncbi:hypothetical protein EON67_03295 [archaeon]|nr:MAG: hypothetical protein EON67_03295 [archaeon]